MHLIFYFARNHYSSTNSVDIEKYLDKLVEKKLEKLTLAVEDTNSLVSDLKTKIDAMGQPNMQETNGLLSVVATQLTMLVSKFNETSKSNANEQDPDRDYGKSMELYSGRSSSGRGQYPKITLIYFGPDVVESFADTLKNESKKLNAETRLLKLSEICANPGLVDGHTCVFIFRRTSTRFVESLTGSNSPTPLELIQHIKSHVSKYNLI